MTPPTSTRPELPPAAAAFLPPYFQTALAAPPARTRWWAWVLGVLLIPVVWLGGDVLIYAVAMAAVPDTPMVTALLLWASFVPLAIGIYLVWRFVHHLPWQRLMSAWPRFRWGNMGRAFAVVMVGYSVWSGLSWLWFPAEWEGYRLQADWRSFAWLLLMTAVFCPIQASAEEWLVRGYLSLALVNWLRAVPGRVVMAFVLSSVLFALLHAGNPESEGQFWPYMLAMVAFGLGMCVLLWVEGGLESAMGYHIANNVFVFAVVGYEDPLLPPSALWTGPEVDVALSDVAWETFGMVVFIALIVLWNRRAALQAPS